MTRRAWLKTAGASLLALFALGCCVQAFDDEREARYGVACYGNFY